MAFESEAAEFHKEVIRLAVKDNWLVSWRVLRDIGPWWKAQTEELVGECLARCRTTITFFGPGPRVEAEFVKADGELFVFEPYSGDVQAFEETFEEHVDLRLANRNDFQLGRLTLATVSGEVAFSHLPGLQWYNRKERQFALEWKPMVNDLIFDPLLVGVPGIAAFPDLVANLTAKGWDSNAPAPPLGYDENGYEILEENPDDDYENFWDGDEADELFWGPKALLLPYELTSFGNLSAAQICEFVLRVWAEYGKPEKAYYGRGCVAP
ncbi:hypothetical protein GGR54DRAFT_491746 [Hypoxylon sp. NC1633]|nr:hypothetical protein GGR54DRAFT_491746 [Hypoxylon sp. NC1633]